MGSLLVQKRRNVKMFSTRIVLLISSKFLLNTTSNLVTLQWLKTAPDQLVEKRFAEIFMRPSATPHMMTNGSHKHLVQNIQRKFAPLTLVKLYRGIRSV